MGEDDVGGQKSMRNVASIILVGRGVRRGRQQRLTLVASCISVVCVFTVVVCVFTVGVLAFLLYAAHDTLLPFLLVPVAEFALNYILFTIGMTKPVEAKEVPPGTSKDLQNPT